MTYRFSRADLWRLTRILYRPGWRRRLLPPLVVLAILVGAVVYGVGHWPNARQWQAVAARWDLIALTLGLLVFALFQHLISMAIVTLRFRSFAIADKTVSLTFGSDSIDGDIEGIASHIPWSRFLARIEEPDRVFLKIARWEAVMVPRRAFPSDAAYRSAVAFLREKVPHGPS